MENVPTIYNNSRDFIILPPLTTNILKFLGLYNTLVNNHPPTSWISYVILFIIQLFHISGLITLFTQENITSFTFSIPTFIPLIFFTTYLLIFYFPNWAYSDNLKKILKNKNYASKFDNIIKLFIVLEVIFCFPLYIIFIIYNPRSFWENDKLFLDIIAKMFNILLIPYGIITHTYLALLYSTLCIFTKYTCDSIIEYSNRIKDKITKNNFINNIKKDQEDIEDWCQKSYELIGKPIGILSGIIGLCMIIGLFILIFVNNSQTDFNIIIIDSISIVIYGSIIDFILYKTSRWHSTFNKTFGDWKNNIEYIPFINNSFKNLVCFDKWLESHDSSSFKLFGINGIKVDYNLILKLTSVSISIISYIISKFLN